MTDRDIAVSVTAMIPTPGALNKKPVYLILLENGKTMKKFIVYDRIELLNGFIQVKGIFSELSEEEIIKNYSEILTNNPKELLLEMMFPWHKISSIRSLVFRKT